MINKEISEFPLIYGMRGEYVVGWGAHTTVGDECKKAGIKNALIVTTGLRGTGIIDEIESILNYHGVATQIYNKVTTNTKDYEVMAGYEAYKAGQCDGVVSVGGGSSHNCGGALRVVACNDGRQVSDFASGMIGPRTMPEGLEVKPVTIPQIAVNTTAGTGAEMGGGGGFFTNTKLRCKQICNAPITSYHIGINDPLLYRIMPATMAAWSGWDAFSHCYECYLSRINVPATLGLTLKGVEMFAQNIREFTYNRMNHVACENMAWVEVIGAYALAFGGGASLVHLLGHHISACTDSHHGRTNAVLASIMSRYNEPACPEKFAAMARAMGVDTTGMTKMQAADKWFDEIERLLADLNIKSGHLNEQFGLKKEDLKHVVDMCASESLPGSANPRGFNAEEWLELMESAF